MCVGITKVHQIYLIETKLLIQVQSVEVKSCAIQSWAYKTEIQRWENSKIVGNVQENSIGSLNNVPFVILGLCIVYIQLLRWLYQKPSS